MSSAPGRSLPSLYAQSANQGNTDQTADQRHGGDNLQKKTEQHGLLGLIDQRANHLLFVTSDYQDGEAEQHRGEAGGLGNLANEATNFT